MNRRTAIKMMMSGGALALGGCKDIPVPAKVLTVKEKLYLADAISVVETGCSESSMRFAELKGKNGELGPFQLTEIYVDDVNRIAGTEYRYYDRSQIGMCRGMITIYWDYYATAKRLGHEPTLEDLARIHNGGPNGYKKQSTKVYWDKVKVELAKM
ncbi:hypothetical protein LCGC14_2183980 [marine sediment metagenome]|uniref:Transglycosylase SLT domain-containing protein n=1 Tax=marine sediment metagenome TaxID=412755 RepID=A0A0F9E8I4_9ZZZZ